MQIIKPNSVIRFGFNKFVLGILYVHLSIIATIKAQQIFLKDIY